ncbi:MAG TPA: peptidase C1, partial [Bacteroidetes bacterium]|nr:peptidase C1 [Bacteroidota bacterium]
MKNFLRMMAVLLLTAAVPLASQAQDKAIYVTKKIRGKERKVLSMDFSRIKRPQTPEEMNPVFHNPPVRQDTTGTCWAFATTSFLESELYRLYGQKIKLSEMFTVYHEYLEKARRFVREKGNSAFGQGSEHNAVLLRMKQYGAVPRSAYSGLLPGRTGYNHSKMFREMKNYLNFVKEHGYWYEDQVLDQIRHILNRYMGEPPETISVNGREMSPKEFLSDVLKLPLDDYVPVMST